MAYQKNSVVNFFYLIFLLTPLSCSSTLSKDGVVTEYYKNGNLKFVTEYKNGKANGIHRIYDEAGNLKTAVFYEDGRMAMLNVYYPDGLLWMKELYANDKIIEKREYDREGNLISQNLPK